MYRFCSFLLVVLLAGAVLPLEAQEQRPVPYPVIPTPQFEQAVEFETRSLDGRPGPEYWTNYATYDIDAILSPATARLGATGTITYENRSPDQLIRLVVNLYQNVYDRGSERLSPLLNTEGIDISCAYLNDEPILERRLPTETGYMIAGTKMVINPPQSIQPGESVKLRLCWDFQVPDARNNMRMGQDGEVYYLGYWYPQMAVYDDLAASIVPGWDLEPYLGEGEFYMGYADYDVSISVPNGWLVAATGELSNPTEILSEITRLRLAEAAEGPDVIQIVTDSTRSGALVEDPSGVLTWNFKAENVRDFAFAASDEYVWDATYADVGDVDGDGTGDTSMIHAFYRPEAHSWNRSAEFSKFSIEHMSERLLPYPWPHMTAVEGIISGGMEYPMMTLIGGERGDRSLFGVTYHELAHMWFPMIVGQDEKTYAWMDEGLTSFNTREGHRDFWPDTTIWDPIQMPYFQIAGTGLEVESMRHADRYPLGTPARGIASYNKPSMMLHALRGILGNEQFYTAFSEYARRWAYKHPTPYDFFNTFEDVVEEDLDWFWTTAFYETWTLDHAIADVESDETGVRITIHDQGLSTMPAPVRVTYEDGRTEAQTVDVSVWLNGQREAKLTFPPGEVEKVEIDPEKFLPDVRRGNNVWQEE